jgi:hypothetical protein
MKCFYGFLKPSYLKPFYYPGKVKTSGSSDLKTIKVRFCIKSSSKRGSHAIKEISGTKMLWILIANHIVKMQALEQRLLSFWPPNLLKQTVWSIPL